MLQISDHPIYCQWRYIKVISKIFFLVYSYRIVMCMNY